MGRSTSSGPDDSTARSFVRLGVPRLLARLYRYATSTLRLAAIDADHADGVEAVDLVHTLVEKGLSGTLTWTLPEDATDEEVVGYACSKLYGLRSTLRRKADLTGRDDDDALEERADQAPGALDQLVAHRMRVDIEQAFAHDAEASAYLGRMLSGMKRAEIMKELGMTNREHADVVHKRIKRGIAALCVRMNTNREDEPPSSGPRGSHHEPQATEERYGAPPEPHRSAVGAGRRR